jgi:hypothetical protein
MGDQVGGGTRRVGGCRARSRPRAVRGRAGSLQPPGECGGEQRGDDRPDDDRHVAPGGVNASTHSPWCPASRPHVGGRGPRRRSHGSGALFLNPGRNWRCRAASLGRRCLRGRLAARSPARDALSPDLFVSDMARDRRAPWSGREDGVCKTVTEHRWISSYSCI